jgi:hypothetical protein
MTHRRQRDVRRSPLLAAHAQQTLLGNDPLREEQAGLLAEERDDASLQFGDGAAGAIVVRQPVG